MMTKAKTHKHKTTGELATIRFIGRAGDTAGYYHEEADTYIVGDDIYDWEELSHDKR